MLSARPIPCILSFVLVVAGIGLHPAPSDAAVTSITSDGTLGTTVTQAGHVFNINGGTIKGNNLLHSLGSFSIGTSDIAAFNGPNGITTIVGRITGGQQSVIDGTLRSTIPGANLYLFNPSGVVFSSHATVDVKGSLHVSTADYLRFADGAKLFASLPQGSSLTAAPPAAFGFLGPTAAGIAIQGSSLQVPTKQTLSMIGGDIQMAGGVLQAPSGRIQIASVASPGEVALSTDLNVGSFATLGQIQLSNQASLNVSGNGGGTVVIRGGNLSLQNSSMTAATTGAADGAALGIDLNLSGNLNLAGGSSIATRTTAAGRGGDVQVSAPQVVILDGSSLSTTTTLRGGQGGNISLVSGESIDIAGHDASGNSSSVTSVTQGNKAGGSLAISSPFLTLDARGTISSSTQGAGSGGDIVLTTGRMALTNGAQVVSNVSRTGPGGNVNVTAGDTVSISGASGVGPNARISGIFSNSVFAPGAGRAGDIALDVGTLSLGGGAVIQSGSILNGPGGNVTVTARDSIGISGGSGISSQAFKQDVRAVTLTAPTVTIDNGFIDTSTQDVGRAGDISMNVGTLSLTNGAQLVSSVQLSSPGHGGNIAVNSRGTIAISGGSGRPSSSLIADGSSGIFSTTDPQSSGAGGSIKLQANQVQLASGGTISAKSSGTGDAGSVTIAVGDTFTSQNSLVTTQARQADGGNISITGGTLFHLVDSQITTSVGSGKGKGGNITIDPQFVILDRSQIRADAFGGPGGNILIVADVYLTQDSIVSASSALGVPGTISVQASITDLSGNVARLPEAGPQAAALLRASCAVRMSGGKLSSLVVAGREGVPPDPQGVLPSPLLDEGPSGARLSWGEDHQWETFPRLSQIALDSTCRR